VGVPVIRKKQAGMQLCDAASNLHCDARLPNIKKKKKKKKGEGGRGGDKRKFPTQKKGEEGSG